MRADGRSLDLFAPRAEAVASPPQPAAARDEHTEPRVWSVTEVNRAVREIIEGSVAPLWVSGEVANWTAHRSGHRYFTLKDEHAQLRCVMWRSDARRLPIDPDNGMNVRVFGKLTLYEARGEYQFSARRLEARDAEGLWRLAFEKLRRELEADGLLDTARKRPLPSHPRRVGIVTSATGAALRDVLAVLRRRAPWTRVIVRCCRVQGDGAAAEVADAIGMLAASGRADVLIVGRGGGSIEDLWAFNEDAVARAIAACPLPVISGVGHEVDVTIADLVADYRAPTPTAAAEAAVPDGPRLAEEIRWLPARLARALQSTVGRRGRRVSESGERLERTMRAKMDPARLRVAHVADSLEVAVGQRLERCRQELRATVGRLNALSPLDTLRRGYAVALGDAGRVLRGTGDFRPGRRFRLRVSDGVVRCRAEQTERIGEPGIGPGTAPAGAGPS